MDQTIRLFNSQTGRCDAVLQSDTPDLCHVAGISRSRFVCSSKTTLVVWDVDKQQYIDTINCQHYVRLTCLWSYLC
jgi:WD40 repeat protein